MNPLLQLTHEIIEGQVKDTPCLVTIPIYILLNCNEKANLEGFNLDHTLKKLMGEPFWKCPTFGIHFKGGTKDNDCSNKLIKIEIIQKRAISSQASEKTRQIKFDNKKIQKETAHNFFFHIANLTNMISN